MKQLSRSFLMISLGLMVFLTGCEFAPRQSDVGPSASLKMVEPTDGSQFKVGDLVQVRSQVNSPDGAISFDLLVNGQVYRSDQPTQPLTNGTMLQPWQPNQPGSYALQVQMNMTGSLLTSKVIMVEVTDEDIGDVELEPTTVTPIPQITISPSIEPTITPTNTETPTITLGPPMATANQTANCRYGPGEFYDLISHLGLNQSSLIVGRNQTSSWWVIERVDGIFGTCWIWDGIVTISGDISNVPVVEPPPTPTSTPFPVAAPVLLAPSGSLKCTSTVFLEWEPVSHPNGIDYYEWSVSGSSGTETGQTTDTKVEFFLPTCESSYSWKVRAVDGKGTISPFSKEMTFTIN